MTFRFADGLGFYGTTTTILTDGKWTTIGSTSGSIFSLEDGRFSGSKCARFKSATASLGKGITATAGVIVGFAFRYNSAPGSTQRFLEFRDVGTDQVTVYLTTGGALQVRRSTLTILGTTSVTLSQGVWYHLEIRLVINNSTGEVEISLNGNTGSLILDLASQDTQQTVNASIDDVNFVGITAQNVDIGDVYIIDTTTGTPTTFRGDNRIQTLFPNGAGDNTDWTINGGDSNNYEAVDENPPDDDTTYNSSSTSTDKDTHAFGNLSGSVDTIELVQNNIRARKDDAGAAEITALTKSGTTENSGTSTALGTDYTVISEIETTDPDTASAWTASGVNAGKWGYENTS